ncbi:hypothetical protein [Streptomyces sp. JJ38]|uniref:hypothetical protein n=1 Tax=Streptomyces sp. JJ38 TaxID=2738128 RepID=UPI001C59A2DE|nr:hypothetical protein [Streptomyces sp. JJ38]MBW1595863.1 hypothetical protein [Streptomyces sp. JJ38]
MRGLFRRWYGASPLHLLLVLASFALTMYAGVRLLDGDTVGVLVWFLGAALLHDLVFLPLYGTVDRVGRGVLRAPPRGVVNFVRVPAFLSGLLLLTWYPLILGRVDHFTRYTALPDDVFLGRWLLITAVLFGASALALVLRTWWRALFSSVPPRG